MWRMREVTVGRRWEVDLDDELTQILDHQPLAASGATGTSYVTADHLGSTRVVTDTGGAAKKCYAYLPFGEQIPSSIGGRSSRTCYAAADTFRQKFTGQARAAARGLGSCGAAFH